MRIKFSEIQITNNIELKGHTIISPKPLYVMEGFMGLNVIERLFHRQRQIEGIRHYFYWLVNDYRSYLILSPYHNISEDIQEGHANHISVLKHLGVNFIVSETLPLFFNGIKIKLPFIICELNKNNYADLLNKFCIYTGVMCTALSFNKKNNVNSKFAEKKFLEIFSKEHNHLYPFQNNLKLISQFCEDGDCILMYSSDNTDLEKIKKL